MDGCPVASLGDELTDCGAGLSGRRFGPGNEGVGEGDRSLFRRCRLFLIAFRRSFVLFVVAKFVGVVFALVVVSLELFVWLVIPSLLESTFTSFKTGSCLRSLVCITSSSALRRLPLVECEGGGRGEEEVGRGAGEGERRLRFLPGDRLLPVPSVSTMCSSANDMSESWPDPL